MIDSNVIGQACRDLRNKLGITQEELAEDAGVTRQTVINFENGKADSFKLLIYFLSFKPDFVAQILNKNKDQSGSTAVEVIIILMLVCCVVFLIVSMGV